MTSFLVWRRRCEEIEQEMNRLLTQGIPKTEADRQVRDVLFRSLIEKREAAARDLLPKPSPRRPRTER
jgi:hypothetical protein